MVGKTQEHERKGSKMSRFGSLGATLGAFGRSVISRLQEIGQTVASALRLGRVAGVEVEPAAVTREWGQVQIAGEREGQFATLGPGEAPPVDWYEMSEIPWDKPICYTVAAYGRDIATGRFAHQEYWITVSRPLTSEEILDEAQSRLGMEGQSPTMDIYSVKLIGGSRRLGEEWRW